MTIIMSACGQEDDEIHIAMVGPLTGNSASVGKSFRQGIRLYVDQINKKGGLHHKKIVIDFFDDQNDPAKAEKLALKITDQEALAVIGHHYSVCSIAAGAVYKEKGIAAITPASTNVKVTFNNSWYFRSSFNDNMQGRFLANYAKTVLQQNRTSIIYDDSEYGNFLASTYANTCKDQDVFVKYVWHIKLGDADLNQKITAIVADLKTKPDAGVIFLATHSTEGTRIIKLIKDNHIRNPILGPDAFASESFRDSFMDYPNEKKKPGFYTNGMYVTTPLIFDTTNEKGLQFKEAYQNRYNEEPGWHAAFAYDTAMVVLDAIANAGIKTNNAEIDADRMRIRNYLAHKTSIEDAIEGVTGYNYFNTRGDSQKPVFMGVYKNQKLICALTQFQTIPNINQIPNLNDAIKNERILMFDNKYSYKTNAVYTGIKINEISEVDIQKLTCSLDFFLWFRYQGGNAAFDIKNIEFVNAADPMQLGEAVLTKKQKHLTYRLYHVKGRFHMDFFPQQFIYGQHVMGVSFRHHDLERNNLIFVKDTLGMGNDKFSARRNLLKKINRPQVLNPVMGWAVNQIWFFQDIVEKDSLGDPERIDAQGETIQFSRFNFGMRINRTKLTLRRAISSQYAGYLLIFSIIMTLILRNALNHKKAIWLDLSSYSKIGWFVQIIFAVLLLLTTEIYLLNRFGMKLTASKLDLITVIFNMSWWLMPALLLSMGIDRFVWEPIEDKTDRSVPKLIRNLVVFFIFLMASFGIIAFEFHQKLTSLLATSGVIAMIVGMAIQINIANIFSGIAINIERPFRIGDWIKLGQDKEGCVLDINWRATRIQTRDDTILTIPNNKASDTSIENFSYPNEGYWQYFTIHVEPANQPERVKKILLDAAMAAKGVKEEPPPTTRFLGLTAGMTGQSQSWAANYLVSTYMAGYSKKFAHNEAVWEQIWLHLKLAGIKHVMERTDIQLLFQGIKPKKSKQTKNISILYDIDIFQPFSDEAKVYISNKMQRQYFPPGQMVVQEDAAGDSLFIIIEGVLGVWNRTKDNQSIEVARLGAGNFFGEMALLTGESRAATIISISDTYLYEITKADIYPLIKKQPEIFFPLSEVLSERKLATQTQMNNHTNEHLDKETLSNQILNKIQSFFGF